MLHPGDTIDRFTVEALLGSGGTAVVYRVRHQSLGTSHALKVLSVTSDVIRERMLMEGRVQATLDHPNIVAVTDVVEVEGAPGLLMEHVEGPSLDQAVQKYRISQSAAETLFLGVVAGVRQAHQAGLVHRDLKPANVLLARTIEGFVPKVTDFGLAKVLEETRDGQDGHTRSGVALGTPAYMAPEQIRDARSVDRRADIFALGCLLYELMTRRRAFPGDDTIAIYNNVLDGRVVPPRHWVPDLPDRLDNAIKGCLVVDREARIPDTDTLLAVIAGERVWPIPDRPVVDPDEIELIPELGPSAGAKGGLDLQVARSQNGLISQPRGNDPLLQSIHDQTGRGLLPQGPRPPTPVPAPEVEVEHEPVPRSGWLFLGGATVVFLLALGFAVVGTVLVLMSSFAPTPLAPTDEVGLSTSDVLGEPPEPPPEVVASAAEPAPAPVQSAPTAPTQPEPTQVIALPATAVLKVLTVPPTALVRLDGAQHGRTPAKLDVPPGRYTVEVESGGRLGRFPIQVRAGVENKWCYVFDGERAVEGACP